MLIFNSTTTEKNHKIRQAPVVGREGGRRQHQVCPCPRISRSRTLRFLHWPLARGWRNSGDGNGLTGKHVHGLWVLVPQPLCNTPGKQLRLRVEKSTAPHLAPVDRPKVLLNATSVFLPKTKRLGNATHKVTHAKWDFTVAGHHPAPSPQAISAQVGGVRSCL